jgi:hypothetical protein
MEILLDPMWQLIGIVTSFVTLAVAIEILRRRKHPAQANAIETLRLRENAPPAHARDQRERWADILGARQDCWSYNALPGLNGNPAQAESLNDTPDFDSVTRPDDGLLMVGIAADFLYKFPVTIGALAANRGKSYTPENFGADNWLDVFKRLIRDEYFKFATETAMESISLETKVLPGPRFEPYYTLAKQSYRRRQGLDDDV